MFEPANLFFKNFDKQYVGFDDLFNKVYRAHDAAAKHIPNYPPYNIKRVDDNKYVMEFAVAGFSKSDIEITLNNDVLNITGKTHESDEETATNFIYKGIADRSFTRIFSVADQLEIKNAELLNGMLRIFLELIIPEHKKPKKIEIKGEDNKKQTPEFLTE